ncbi:MAG: shikimate dehydrogenase [Candidatus Omnitrophica bacterium]|nr:shikimate dehydrogenase [Candidatus Omnitrophota bacterium]
MDAQSAVYGIIGYPVAHSLSPLMHNTAFKELGVDAVYKLFPLKENELDIFFAELRKPSSPIFGLNVTVPYKEAVLEYLDNIAPLAQKIMAVNTIVINKERKLLGYNTDAPGFLAHLVELQFNTRDKKIAIMGSGGSARAILAVLCMIPERPDSIKIYNRTPERLDNLLEDLSARIDTSIAEPVASVDDLDIPGADLLINTTSVGLKPEDPGLVDEELLHRELLVYDLVYNPPLTPLLKMAKARGARVANGLGMLYYQGVLAFQHWANVLLDDDIKFKMRQALEKGVSQSMRS